MTSSYAQSSFLEKLEKISNITKSSPRSSKNNQQFTNLNVAGVMPAMLVTRVGIFTNETMSIKDLDQYSIAAKVNIHQEQ